MSQINIDLYSDTQTRPTLGMRKAMADAVVGDEQSGEDPTVNRLCDMVAELTGKEAGVFMPSGTMCNQVAICVHCRPGDEIIADKTTHIMSAEAGGPSAIAGAQFRPVDGDRGIFSAEQVDAAVRPDRLSAPRSGMIEIEQTSNAGGGSVWPLESIREIRQVADRHGLPMHMDGARLMNAVVASNVTAKDYAEPFDSLWVDLSKGLGCPVGAVLVGSKEFIAEAWRWKKRLGGAMRQSGIIAAAGIYALENNVDRLADDHANAKLLAERLAAIPGINVWPAETNLVFFDIKGTKLTAPDLKHQLAAHGVRIGNKNDWEIRAVTHLDVDSDQIETAAGAVAELVGTA